MLVLTRRVGERILIGDDVILTVVRSEDGSVRIGVEAPKEMVVLRAELARHEGHPRPGARRADALRRDPDAAPKANAAAGPRGGDRLEVGQQVQP